MRQSSRVPGTLRSGLSALALSIGVLCPTTMARAQGVHTNTHQIPSHARITAAQAQAIALKKYPGKIEGQIKLEDEEGSWQYAVNIRSGKTLREVMVDANNGRIANMEVTTKAEEAKEQKADAAKMKQAHTAVNSHKIK